MATMQWSLFTVGVDSTVQWWCHAYKVVTAKKVSELGQMV